MKGTSPHFDVKHRKLPGTVGEASQERRVAGPGGKGPLQAAHSVDPSVRRILGRGREDKGIENHIQRARGRSTHQAFWSEPREKMAGEKLAAVNKQVFGTEGSRKFTQRQKSAHLGYLRGASRHMEGSNLTESSGSGSIDRRTGKNGRRKPRSH